MGWSGWCEVEELCGYASCCVSLPRPFLFLLLSSLLLHPPPCHLSPLHPPPLPPFLPAPSTFVPTPPSLSPLHSCSFPYLFPCPFLPPLLSLSSPSPPLPVLSLSSPLLPLSSPSPPPPVLSLPQCDANPDITKVAIQEDKYENVLTLITYYQMVSVKHESRSTLYV